MRTPFFGPFNVSRSKDFSDQQLINLYTEINDAKSAKEVGAFYGTPGLDFLGTIGPGPVRGLRAVEGALYGVSGQGAYSIAAPFVSTPIGTIATSAGPVSMIDNGKQVAIFDGVSGYSISSGVLSPIDLPFNGPVIAGYQDGFGFVNQVGTDQWWQSNIFDLTTWDPLNFSAANSKPDDLVAIGDLHREVYLFKEKFTEIWINAGIPGFVFQRLEGVFMEAGCAAPHSVAVCGEEIVWLGRTERGEGQVYLASGYEPKTVSTQQLSSQIDGYATISDAFAYSYQQEGHIFYVLTFPSANMTWVLDLTETAKAGVPMWHRRASFLNGKFNRHQSNCHAYFNRQHVVGDWQSGNLYALDLDTFTDNGAQRKWLRSWRASAKPVDQPMRFSSLEIDCETGIKVPDGTNPQMMLRWSDDGGHNFSNTKYCAVGRTGETSSRVKFNRLGSTRLGTGLDRIFELSSTDQFKVALVGAILA